MYTYEKMIALFITARQRRASDIHLTAGMEPIFRINGDLISQPGDSVTNDDLTNFLNQCAGTKRAQLDSDGEIDFSYAVNEARFRVNAYRQQDELAVAMRIIPSAIPTIDSLGLPESAISFAMKKRGLILVTGPAGSGKSTTLAAMIDYINHYQAKHIITLEDPIEYLYNRQKSIIHQREINSDSHSFASALRAALREDPDVILIGEMRDVETIAIALTAAETGHLVLATLHTSDAIQTIDRIIDVFPPNQHQQIRTQLSLNLQGIICQQLLPKMDGSGRVAALEILTVNPAVRNLIRCEKSNQIGSVIETGTKFGMQSMDSSLCDLYKKKIISYDDAISSAIDQEYFTRLTSDKSDN